MRYLPIVLFIVTIVTFWAMSRADPLFRHWRFYWIKRHARRDYEQDSSASWGGGLGPFGRMFQRVSPPELDRRTRSLMRVFVSIVILGCAVYIVLSHSYDLQEKHWAYGSLGTILGFWLRGSK
jgi:hypothetical protein